MSYPTPINDSRLTSDMRRTRSGSTQLFRRDYGDRQFTDRENADVVLEPPERHIYAELIDGVWCWVNGCAECNGKPRDWMTYIECDAHNVCRTCGASRSELSEAPWGGRNGWQCKPCAASEHEAEKIAALAAMPEEYDPLDYWHEDHVMCPYCNHTIEDSGDGELYSALEKEIEVECDRCDETFLLEAESQVKWTMNRRPESEEHPND